MKTKIIGLFVCMLLIATVVPAVESINNGIITPMIPNSNPQSCTRADWVQMQKLLAPEDAAGDLFGRSVSLDGDTALIGVPFDDDNGVDSGSAYVFTRTGAIWTQQAWLLASDGAVNGFFGYSVFLDGDTALIGVPYGDDGKGSAYVYAHTGTNWTQQQKFNASDGAIGDGFGGSVSLDGDSALIGAFMDDDNGHLSGSAYVFTRTGSTWTQQAKLLASDGAAGDYFGWSVSLSGDTALIGAWLDDDNGVDSGSAFVFTRTGTTWIQQQKLLASDGTADDHFSAYTISVSGSTALIGAEGDDDNGVDSGSAYVFTRTYNTWTQQAKLLASDGAAGDYFGWSVSLSGDTALIGADRDDDNGGNSGSAYVFTRTYNTWTQQAKLLASDGAAGDYFGEVSLDGDTALIGAMYDDDNGVDSGSAYVYTHTGTNWTHQAKLIASENRPPNTPTITGPADGKVGIAYDFNFMAIDLDGDEVYYVIDWGDGSYTDWLGPYSSGQIVNTSHSWSSFGSYEISVKAKDRYYQESNWSTPLIIHISYSSAILFGVFLVYEEYPDGQGIVAPFFGFYIQFNPFNFKLYTRSTPPMVGVLFDTSTKKGVISPGLIPTQYGSLGIIAGKFDAIVTPMY